MGFEIFYLEYFLIASISYIEKWYACLKYPIFYVAIIGARSFILFRIYAFIEF